MSDISVITSEIFVAYSQCPRKAFLLLFSEDKGKHHDYPLILEERRQNNRVQYLEKFLQSHPDARGYDTKAFKKYKFLVDAKLKSEQLEANCAVLTRMDTKSANRRISYEPTIVTGTYSITPEQKSELLFVGIVLSQIQKQLPVSGHIISMDGKAHRIRLENGYKNIKASLKTLQSWCKYPPTDPPSLVLNKYCSSCQFQQTCRQQAEKENHLSLLDRMTAKAVQKYNKRGIFTVKQLSYLFKPRRNRKQKKETALLRHSLELQALSIRDKKIYLQEKIELPRKSTELFLDIESIPDQDFYYLIGLLILEDKNKLYNPFWANTLGDESQIFNKLIEKLREYPEAPIYHYGNYEAKAINALKIKYSADCLDIEKRLININSYVYGKIYFPVCSNSLKQIGNFLGFSWSSSEASGLQCIFWRYKFEEAQDNSYKQKILAYNEEDCLALSLVTDTISNFEKASSPLLKVGFADQPQKFSTESGELVHRQFDIIVQTAHKDYDKNKISLRKNKHKKDGSGKKRGIKKVGTRTHRKVIPKAQKIIQVPRDKICPNCKNSFLRKTDKVAERNIIDLVFLKSAIKKIVFKYRGFQGYCPKCSRYHSPSGIRQFDRQQIYGHGFQVWMVYQRLELRLPYRTIVRAIEELFNESINSDTAARCLTYVARFYQETEQKLLKNLLNNPFVHVDETRVSIEGKDWYVWVITNGTHTVFKLTETRETEIIREILLNYKGVLVSDFYPGYDSLECRQQKCWVHLIRDLNYDLWKDPFDSEFESFVISVRNLIVPIFEAVEKYGLKRRNLNKFKKAVAQFYDKEIDEKIYLSEVAKRYQKRFIRYRKNLFQFLEEDGIPWHNNTAENAIRHFAIQRTISGSFYESTTRNYLLLLGIKQTCRFQNKPFLKFLLSGEKDVDKFKAPRPKKSTRPVGKPKQVQSNSNEKND
ncbi:MAG: TM0106 family RecB-like putative nuclease [Cyanobacteria bacterium P01_C01_bin.118]